MQSNCGETVYIGWPSVYKKPSLPFPCHAVVSKTRGVKEACMLHLPNAISILPLLLLFLTPIQRRDAGLAVTPCVRVENPYIKKRTLSLPQHIAI